MYEKAPFFIAQKIMLRLYGGTSEIVQKTSSRHRSSHLVTKTGISRLGAESNTKKVDSRKVEIWNLICEWFLL